MNATRALAIAEFMCGPAARRSVFEPLVADWQRELATARSRGFVHAWRSAVVGSAAFCWSVGRCAVASGVWVPPARGAAISLMAFALSIAVAKANLLLVIVNQGRPLDLSTPLVPAFLLGYSTLMIPSAMLVALFVLRREPRSTARHATLAIAAGVALTCALAVWTTPDAINDRFTTFEVYERDYERALANDRAGRIQYPWTAVRQLRPPTTRDERRQSFDRFLKQRADLLASRPPATWQERLQQFQPAALSLLFGIMGWTLAGSGASLARAIGWWVLMYLGLLAFTDLLSYTVGELAFRTVRLPYWTALPTFGLATLALLAATRRNHQINRAIAKSPNL